MEQEQSTLAFAHCSIWEVSTELGPHLQLVLGTREGLVEVPGKGGGLEGGLCTGNLTPSGVMRDMTVEFHLACFSNILF